MDEKRETARIEKNLIVMYSNDVTEGNYENVWDTTFIKNISETGMLLNTKRQFQVNEKIRLMFKVPLDPFHWLETLGVVVESSESTYASSLTRIKFIDLNESHKKLVRDYINWFLRKKEEGK